MSGLGGWTELRAHLERSREGAKIVTETHVQVPVTVRRHEQDHDVTIDVRALPGAPQRIAISTEVGSARYLPPLEVLHLNFMVAVGTICLFRGMCLLRQTLPLVGVHTHHLDAVIDAIADKSETIKARLAKG